jgi:hypothetical protein
VETSQVIDLRESKFFTVTFSTKIIRSFCRAYIISFTHLPTSLLTNAGAADSTTLFCGKFRAEVNSQRGDKIILKKNNKKLIFRSVFS